MCDSVIVSVCDSVIVNVCDSVNVCAPSPSPLHPSRPTAPHWEQPAAGLQGEEQSHLADQSDHAETVSDRLH